MEQSEKRVLQERLTAGVEQQRSHHPDAVATAAFEFVLSLLASVGTHVRRSRMAPSIACSISLGECRRAMSIKARVSWTMCRTSLCDRMSPFVQALVVWSVSHGGRCRLALGTRNSTDSVVQPSSPHHRAAVAPYNAADRPSQVLPARTFISHARTVAEWCQRPGTIGTQMSACTAAATGRG